MIEVSSQTERLFRNGLPFNTGIRQPTRFPWNTTSEAYDLRVIERWGVPQVTSTELLEAMEKVGVKVAAPTLREWARKGLISKPKVGSKGRGKGTFSEYPDQAIIEALATHLMFKRGKKTDDILKTKRYLYTNDNQFDLRNYNDAISIRREDGKFVISVEQSELPDDASDFDIESSIEWIMCISKAYNLLFENNLQNLIGY